MTSHPALLALKTRRLGWALILMVIGSALIAATSTSDYGFNRRRRWVSVTETGIEATSLAQLQAICDRKLVTAQQVTETITITHPWLPIDLNEVVEVQHPRLPGPARCVVRSEELCRERV